MHDSIENWIDRFGNKPIPVMQHTITELKRLCQEDLPIHEFVELVETDPGLTVQIIRTCSTSMQGSLRSDVTSVQQALMIIGTEKLKSLPETLPTVEKSLKGSAKEHLLKVFSAAYHAARQSTDWAKLRRDMVPDEVTAASLLHFIGTMLMSIHAPELLDKIRLMRNEKHVASEEAQYIVLGFTFDQLSLEVAHRWNLPPLLIETLHTENARHPRAYTIMLAVQLARHAAWNWYTPKMISLYKKAAEWLDRPMSVIIRDSHKLAVQAARDSEFYNVNHSAALLLSELVDETEEDENVRQEADEQESHQDAGVCLIPQLAILKDTIKSLESMPVQDRTLQQIVDLSLRGLHDGAGLNRVVFAVYDKPKNIFKAYAIIGADNDPVFGQFQISLEQKNLFSYMSQKIQAVWVNDENREKYAALIPDKLAAIIQTGSFYSMSVLLKNSLFGLFYADRHTTNCQLDKNSYAYFKTICMHSAQCMEGAPKLHR